MLQIILAIFLTLAPVRVEFRSGTHSYWYDCYPQMEQAADNYMTVHLMYSDGTAKYNCIISEAAQMFYTPTKRHQMVSR